MSKKIAYMLLDKHLTIVIDGHAHDVDAQHPRHAQIVALLKRPALESSIEEDVRAKRLLKAIKSDKLDLRVLSAQVGFSDVQVDHGVVTVKGQPMRTSLTARIVELQMAGLPYEPFVRFLVNLQANPSEESRNALFDFLEQGRFPLTDDGCFLGYKGVVTGILNGKSTLLDSHTLTFDMSPGNVHEMPRDQVDNNRGIACGAGFHVGTIGHAKAFGDKMIVVKVDPKDAVSVPTSDRTKLRCCKYEVVNVYENHAGAQELALPVYTKDQYAAKDFDKKTVVSTPKEALNDLNRDQLVRKAVDKGLVQSVNEARALGKELLIKTLFLGKIPFADMTKGELAGLAVRRHHFVSERVARKAGSAKMIAALTA